jgi:hypothetical protein
MRTGGTLLALHCRVIVSQMRCELHTAGNTKAQ